MTGPVYLRRSFRRGSSLLEAESCRLAALQGMSCCRMSHVPRFLTISLYPFCIPSPNAPLILLRFVLSIIILRYQPAPKPRPLKNQRRHHHSWGSRKRQRHRITAAVLAAVVVLSLLLMLRAPTATPPSSTPPRPPPPSRGDGVDAGLNSFKSTSDGAETEGSSPDLGVNDKWVDDRRAQQESGLDGVAGGGGGVSGGDVTLEGGGGKLKDGRNRCFVDSEGLQRCYPTVFFFGTSKCGELLLAPLLLFFSRGRCGWRCCFCYCGGLVWLIGFPYGGV